MSRYQGPANRCLRSTRIARSRSAGTDSGRAERGRIGSTKATPTASADGCCDHLGEGPASGERQMDAVADEVLRMVRGRPVPVREDDVGTSVRRVPKQGV